MADHNPQGTALDFLTVLQELDLQAGRDSAAQWQACGRQLGTPLPADFLQAMSLGADQLLTRYSNDEVMQPPTALFNWNGAQALPLLWENQGNFVFGLALGSQTPAPVFIAHDFEGHHNPQPVHWQMFTPNFATFAFARLFDFQYLLDDWVDDEHWFFDDMPYTNVIATALTRRFKQGATTPDYYNVSRRVRHRFYRTGQRVSISVDEDNNAYWEISAATPALFKQLQLEVRELQSHAQARTPIQP